jgi:hypothetical protein
MPQSGVLASTDDGPLPSSELDRRSTPSDATLRERERARRAEAARIAALVREMLRDGGSDQTPSAAPIAARRSE